MMLQMACELFFDGRLVSTVFGVTSLGSIRFESSFGPNPIQLTTARLYEFRIPVETLCE